MLMSSNLWAEFLKESTKKTQIPESTCILVGDTNCGKKLLIDRICLGEIQNDINRNKEIVSYNFFDIDDSIIESGSRVSLWSFDDFVFEQCSEVLKQVNHSNKLLFLIALDLSRPDECVVSLTKWLSKIASFLGEFYHNQNTDEVNIFKQNHIKYLKHARLNKGNVTKFEENEEISLEGFEFISKYFHVPIIVTACKSDLVLTDDGMSMKKARELQGRLRAICLEVGASLVYVSAIQDHNCTIVKKYIMHRLYPEFIAYNDLTIEEKIEKSFIPSGYDTIDLINIATTVKAAPDEFKKQFEINHLSVNHAKSTNNNNKTSQHHQLHKTASTANVQQHHDSEQHDGNNNNNVPVEMESEQEWLTDLYGFIVKATATGSVTSLPSSINMKNNALSSAASTHHIDITSESPLSIDSSGLTPNSHSTADLTNVTKDKEEPKTTRASRRTSVTKGASDGKSAQDFFNSLLQKK